jgi:acyl-CoA reductase-like NAD-dependent aldehyde dehydrogenase
MAESRSDELVEFVKLSEGVKSDAAKATVAKSIDRIVWYAGWTDKISQVLGGSNPVAGPFYNFSVPKPTGVIGVIAPQDSSLEGFVECVIAPIAAGNSVIALASEKRPVPAVLLGEMTETSDFPAGVLNIITGLTSELAPGLSSHEDIDGLDLEGADATFADELAFLAAGSIKRVLRPGKKSPKNSIHRLRAFVETSTVWHTIGQ